MVVGLRITWYGRLEKGKRYHKWLSEASLMEKYPRLFANSEQNKALVEQQPTEELTHMCVIVYNSNNREIKLSIQIMRSR